MNYRYRRRLIVTYIRKLKRIHTLGHYSDVHKFICVDLKIQFFVDEEIFDSSATSQILVTQTVLQLRELEIKRQVEIEKLRLEHEERLRREREEREDRIRLETIEREDRLLREKLEHEKLRLEWKNKRRKNKEKWKEKN